MTAPSARRSRERRALEGFLDAVPQGTRGLVLEGAAGIGKTRLVEHAVAAAGDRGFRVAVARAGRPSASLSYAALGDLCESVTDQQWDALPAPQRRALEVALLRSSDSEPVRDPRAVCLAALTLVRQAVATRPLLLVIDNLQWLDPSSARVIAFVLQRLDAEPLGLLGSRRTGESSGPHHDLVQALSPQRLDRVEIGPLPFGEFLQVLHSQVDPSLPRSVVLRIHEAVEGNPFYGQEMAREVLRRGLPDPGAPLPVPEDGIGVVLERARSLSPQTSSVLTAAALAFKPTVSLLEEALPALEVAFLLTQAEQSGLVRVRPQAVTFTHPIFAAAVTATTAAPVLRDLHRVLARVIADPEERARHLALSATKAVESTAAALDQAVRRARERGAADAAAELALMAVAHTPQEDGAASNRRRVRAALLAFEAGDATRAHELFLETLDELGPGVVRARVMNQLCEISWMDTVAVADLARRALDEADGCAGVVARAHASLAWVGVYRGELDQAAGHVEAGRVVDPTALADDERADLLIAAALTAFLRGDPWEGLLDEATSLQEGDSLGDLAEGMCVYSSASVVRGLLHLWAGELDHAAQDLTDQLNLFERHGRYLARDEVLYYLATQRCHQGRWVEAESHAQECLEIGEESGHLRGRGQNIVPKAWVAALRGDVAGARRDAQAGLQLSLGFGDLLSATNCRGVLGFAELSEGRTEQAVRHLRIVVRFVRGAGTPRLLVVPFLADAAEAFVGSGHLDEAAELLNDVRLATEAQRRGDVAWARACALLGAASGEAAAAKKQLRAALAVDPGDRPFETARARLILGELERRTKHRAQAEAELDEASRGFEELGATLWAERARDALARVRGGTQAALLTATEERVVRLVVQGMTNSEVAAALFIAPKTVEANLSRIYRKSGVRSRAELIALCLSPQSGDRGPGRFASQREPSAAEQSRGEVGVSPDAARPPRG